MYTQTYAKKTSPLMTGHFSIDFLNESDDTPGKELMQKIYPIECNPRAHTAVVLFPNESEDLAEAYLSILRDDSSSAPKTITLPKPSIITPSTTTGYYGVGYDLVTPVIAPFCDFALRKIDLWTFLTFWVEFIKHVLFWRDGTFEVWDPLPAWWLYCGYWPRMFASGVNDSEMVEQVQC